MGRIQVWGVGDGRRGNGKGGMEGEEKGGGRMRRDVWSKDLVWVESLGAHANIVQHLCCCFVVSQMKELGIIVYNCSCLALDLHRVFNLYWQLQYKDFIPSMWSKRLSALWNKDENLPLLFNNTKAEVFVSVSDN